MQLLWAKLLVGEIEKPGTHSLHTVEFLSRMSPSDANLIAKLGPFVTSAGIIKLGDEFFDSKNISYTDFLYLDDLGIINGTTSGIGGIQHILGTAITEGKTFSTLSCNGAVLVFNLNDLNSKKENIRFDVFSITRVGREILSLGSFQPDEDYLKVLADKGIELGARVVQRGVVHPDGRQIVGLRTIAKREAGPPE
jgi:hypothetical protein